MGANLRTKGGQGHNVGSNESLNEGSMNVAQKRKTPMGHRGMTRSQERSIGRHLVSYVLKGQNGGSINMPFLGMDQECKEYEWKHE